jgi:hypothetical protein
VRARKPRAAIDRRQEPHRQETIEFRKKPGTHGGRRKGAGRKRGKKVQHVARPALNGRTRWHARRTATTAGSATTRSRTTTCT